jgi:S1-C subfamily serine protease
MSAVLSQLSDELRDLTTQSRERVVAIRNDHGQHVSGLQWSSDLIVTSDQSVGHRKSYTVVAQDRSTTARIVGRDPATNVLLLQSETPIQTDQPRAATPRLGEIAIALGTTHEGDPTVRLGLVNRVGGEWFSRAGGRVDARIGLDIRLARTEEGGPVVDTTGALLGFSAFGAGREVLVIPTATIDRVVKQLQAHGHVPRGWLGLALHPIAVPDSIARSTGASVGMMVMSVAESGPGQRAGVMAGDIALTLDETPIHDMRSIAARLSAETVGQRLKLNVVRAGQLLPIEMEITARPNS